MREAVEAAGARLVYLPPHGPDLSLIGMASSKLERLPRRVAESGVGALWDCVGRLLDESAPRERDRQREAPRLRRAATLAAG